VICRTGSTSLRAAVYAEHGGTPPQPHPFFTSEASCFENADNFLAESPGISSDCTVGVFRVANLHYHEHGTEKSIS
jgi:hypothetical protein